MRALFVAMSVLALGCRKPAPAAAPPAAPRAAAPTEEAAPAPPAPKLDPAQFFASERARLLILGTFHFRDAGLDGYKPEHDVDIMSKPRQAELGQLLDRLEAFGPTKIAVEYPKAKAAQLDERYRAHLAKPGKLTPNEIHQVGFRLGRRLGHETLHAVDVQGRRYKTGVDTEKSARAWGQEKFLQHDFDERYKRFYAWEDQLKTKTTLIDHLVLLNSPQALRLSHGHYLVGAVKVAQGDEYPGADHLAGWWYSRNLRIFANIAQLIDSPEDRILLVIGAGHVPIIRHAADASPEIDLVEVADVLAPS